MWVVEVRLVVFGGIVDFVVGGVIVVVVLEVEVVFVSFFVVD